MKFEEHVTCETDNTISNKKEQIIKIAHGIITQIFVLFPPGCHNQVNCVLLHHEHQIAPSTESMTMKGDTFPHEWNEYYESYQPPYELKAKLWGEDCSYDHTVTISIIVLPRRAIIALAVVDAIKSAFGMLLPRRIFTERQEAEFAYHL